MMRVTKSQPRLSLSDSTVSTTINTISTVSSSSRTKDRILRPNLIQSNAKDHNRNRYLGKLGFVGPPPQPRKTSSRQLPAKEGTRYSNGDSKRSCTYKENLNDGNYEYTAHFHTTDARKSKVVSFDNTVCVRIIPSIDMYSDRIRKTLWNTPHDLSRNAERNLKEFAHEKYDYRLAVEEEDFFTCPTTGSRIHPAHVHWMDYVMASRRRTQNSRTPRFSHQATFRRQHPSYIH